MPQCGAWAAPGTAWIDSFVSSPWNFSPSELSGENEGILPVVPSADEHLKQILRDEAGGGDVFIPLGKSSCQGHSSPRAAAP